MKTKISAWFFILFTVSLVFGCKKKEEAPAPAPAAEAPKAPEAQMPMSSAKAPEAAPAAPAAPAEKKEVETVPATGSSEVKMATETPHVTNTAPAASVVKKEEKKPAKKNKAKKKEETLKATETVAVPTASAEKNGGMKKKKLRSLTKFDKYPEFFPWPPPKASAFYLVPRNLLVHGTEKITLDQIAHRIESALEDNGYTEKGYHRIPNGFALVTRIEQINEDGSSKKLPDRWDIENLPNVNSFAEYMNVLNKGKKGIHRFIVFIVTDVEYTQDINYELKEKEIVNLLTKGTLKPSPKVAAKIYDKDYYCTTLIYEYIKIEEKGDARQSNPSKLDGKTHLAKSGILAKL